MSTVEWWEVPEGSELNPEQMVARFLSLNVVDRINYMAHVQAQARRSNMCTQRNHHGAMWFATHHRCNPRKQTKAKRRQIIRQGRKP